MGIYLGSAGLINLQRLSSSAFTTEINTAAINVGQKRLSLDFPAGVFITGDRVQFIRATSTLTFISGASGNETYYLNVDGASGVRLYTTWAASLRGLLSDAITLIDPTATYSITMTLLGDGIRSIGQVINYELSTNTAAIDTTSLGDSFTKQISGLISGAGKISCYWDWLSSNNEETESAQYLHGLVMRQQLGSAFRATFSIKQPGHGSANNILDPNTENQGLYYLVNGLITNVAIAFNPTEALRSEINFITTGAIQMLYGNPSGDLLLQEDSDEILLESGLGSIVIDGI